VHHELFRWRAEVRESGEAECVNVGAARSGRDHCTHGVCLLKHEGRAKRGAGGEERRGRRREAREAKCSRGLGG